MCIAILNIEGKLKDEYIKNSWDNNNQGGGLLYVKKGVLTDFKSYNYKKFLKEYKNLMELVELNSHLGFSSQEIYLLKTLAKQQVFNKGID